MSDGLAERSPAAGAEPTATTGRRCWAHALRRRLLLCGALALGFSWIQVLQSLGGGRLALPPTFDDVAYMLDGLVRLRTLFDEGPTEALVELLVRPPHSPWSSTLVLLSFLIFGVEDWAPAVLNFVVVLGVLLWLVCRSPDLPRRWFLVVAAGLLTWPLLGQAVINVRPDIPSGLLTAITAMGIARQRFVGAAPRHHLLSGVGLGVALLIKPTTGPVTLLVVVAAMAGATATDLSLDAAWRRLRPVATSWARCLATALLVVLPYLLVAFEPLSTYIYTNTFGEAAAAWRPRLGAGGHALYYLSGPGGKHLLHDWLYLWVLSALLALPAALLGRRSLVRLPAIAGLFLVTYAAVTVPSHKNVFLGAPLTSLMLVSWLEMMLLALSGSLVGSGSAPRRIGRLAGRMMAIGLLLLGIWRFSWPQQLLGPPPSRHEIDGHHALLEQLSAHLLEAGEQPAPVRVFFTQIGPYMNGALLHYRLLEGGNSSFTFRDLQLTTDPVAIEHELSRADYLVSFSPGNPNVHHDLPGAGLQAQILEQVGNESSFLLVRSYPTPVEGRLELRRSSSGFYGARSRGGLGPFEGPDPRFDLRFPVRWAFGPSTRLEIVVPASGRGRLVLDMRAAFEPQSMLILAGGRRLAEHRFASPGEFESIELVLDLAPGTRELELRHSRWHQPSEHDDRPRAALVRTLLFLPFLEEDGDARGPGDP